MLKSERQTIRIKEISDWLTKNGTDLVSVDDFVNKKLRNERIFWFKIFIVLVVVSVMCICKIVP